MVLRNAFSFLAAAAAIGALPPAALAAPAGVQPEGRAALYAACLAEAKRPLVDSAAYRNGAMRQREVLANSYVAAVRKGEAMCVRANTAAPSDTACQGANTASDHDRRLGAVCRALTASRR